MEIHKEAREDGEELDLRDVRYGYERECEDNLAAEFVPIPHLGDVELEVLGVEAHQCEEVEEHVVHGQVEDDVHGRGQVQAIVRLQVERVEVEEHDLCQLDKEVEEDGEAHREVLVDQ